MSVSEAITTWKPILYEWVQLALVGSYAPFAAWIRVKLDKKWRHMFKLMQLGHPRNLYVALEANIA